jgi:hypothetical protein
VEGLTTHECRLDIRAGFAFGLREKKVFSSETCPFRAGAGISWVNKLPGTSIQAAHGDGCLAPARCRDRYLSDKEFRTMKTILTPFPLIALALTAFCFDGENASARAGGATTLPGSLGPLIGQPMSSAAAAAAQRPTQSAAQQLQQQQQQQQSQQQGAAGNSQMEQMRGIMAPPAGSAGADRGVLLDRRARANPKKLPGLRKVR